eukprot:UN12110
MLVFIVYHVLICKNYESAYHVTSWNHIKYNSSFFLLGYVCLILIIFNVINFESLKTINDYSKEMTEFDKGTPESSPEVVPYEDNHNMFVSPRFMVIELKTSVLVVLSSIRLAT